MYGEGIRFVHSVSVPGEYIFRTCAKGAIGVGHRGVPGWGKSGWSKRQWLRSWSLSISAASTTTSATGVDR